VCQKRRKKYVHRRERKVEQRKEKREEKKECGNRTHAYAPHHEDYARVELRLHSFFI
jgi:hypothetical protein